MLGIFIKPIEQIFYIPLLQKLDDSTLGSIFANIEDILLFNTVSLGRAFDSAFWY